MKDEGDFEIEMIEDEEDPKESKSMGSRNAMKKSKKKKASNISRKEKDNKTRKTSLYKEDKEIIEKPPSKHKEVLTSMKVAKRMPISEGIKKRLLLDAREITRMKQELRSLKKELRGYENEVEILESETERIRKEKDELEEGLNKDKAIIHAMEKKLDRTHKDFDGYKARIEKEIERKSLMKSKGMIISLIDILDNFERTIQEGKKYENNGPINNIIDGMESIKKAFQKLLSDNRIDIISPKDEQFDPNYHEAIEIVSDIRKRENTVIEVESNGYLLDGVVIKPARVKVTKGGPPWPKKELEKRQTEEYSEDLEDMDELEEIGEE